jgi:hypothetical protein
LQAIAKSYRAMSDVGKTIDSAESTSSYRSDTTGTTAVSSIVPYDLESSSPCKSQNAVASSPTALSIASTALMSNHFKCAKCKKTYPSSQMAMTRSGVCQADAKAYKSLTDRWGKQRKLKMWWSSLTPEQQTDWYLRQQALPQGAKRRFDNIEYSESSIQQANDLEDELDRFRTWPVFLREGMQTGKNLRQLEQEWQEMIADPYHECVFRRGQWCVAEFTGVERRAQKVTKQQMATSRLKNVEDETTLNVLRQGGQDALKTFISSRVVPRGPLPENMPMVTDITVADQPVAQPPTDFVSVLINREVTNGAETPISNVRILRSNFGSK